MTDFVVSTERVQRAMLVQSGTPSGYRSTRPEHLPQLRHASRGHSAARVPVSSSTLTHHGGRT
jgi:hypothetical protein